MDIVEVVKAFVKPETGFEPSDDLVLELQAFVKEREAAYKYPREVEFVDEFPQPFRGKSSVTS